MPSLLSRNTGQPRARSGPRRTGGGRRGAVVVALVAATVGCTNPSGPERELSGKLLYERHCARCHGTDGRPTPEMPTARDLTNASYMKSMNDDALLAVIRKGKPPSMPGFETVFMQPSLEVVAAYVRSLSDPDAGRLRPAASASPDAR